MKILHYTIGFPPERSGGLPRYATDLMNEQVNQGCEVCAFYPGRINILKKRPYLKKIQRNVVPNVDVYELINSLPLPLFGGIKEPDTFMKKIDSSIYKEFLSKIGADVIHVHTLMGLHKEFFKVAKDLKISIVFTSHDYFGLAPEPNFFLNGKSYDKTNTVNDWINASAGAMSTRKLRLFQSKYYVILRKILKKVKYQPKGKNAGHENTIDAQYGELKKYYGDIFNLIDKFHFNSIVSKEVFIKNVKKRIKYKIITITTSDIYRRSFEKQRDKRIRIAYIGPDKEFKGFNEFIKLSLMMKNEIKYEFHSYGYTPTTTIIGINQHGIYNKYELERIYSQIDILIVPSKWKETFGLTVLEAISMNTKVFVSKNTGASELLPEYYKFSTIEELRNKIININLNDGQQNNKIKTISYHCGEVISFYQERIHINESR